MEQEPIEPTTDVAIVVVPFPAHSHLNQFLHFSLLLSSNGLPVHFACSATHNHQAQYRLQGWDPKAVENIHFHDLPLPPFSIPTPDPNATIKFPAHLMPMFEASDHLQAPLAALLYSLSASSRRLIVIHDPLVSFAGHDATSLPNAEVYRFHCLPAFFLLSFFHNQDLAKLAQEPISESLNLLLTPLDDILTEDFAQFVGRRWKDNPLDCGTIVNTCRLIENEFVELLGQQPAYRNKKIYAVGPLHRVVPTKEGLSSHECLQWLSKQPLASVVYVSFGTTSTISDEQIEQLAVGLQRSGQRFIWVLKDADLADIFTDSVEGRQRKLPMDFEEEVAGVGMLIRGWAPQLDILAHPSTGAFVSHCGWNSCLESMSMGVPIIAWPMHSDQPRNALIITTYWKAGVAVREWPHHERVISSAEVEEAIKMLMVHDEGKEIRKRAESLKQAIQLATSTGGASRTDLDSFVAHIARP